MLISCALFAGATHAWFSDHCSAQIKLQSAIFDVDVEVALVSDEGTPTETPATSMENGIYVYNLSAGTYSVTLTRDGSASVGYCEIKVGDNVYYSPNLPAQTENFSFTLTIAGDNVPVTFTPVWSDVTKTDSDLILTSKTRITYADPNANPTDSGTVSGSDAVDDTRVTPIPSAFDPVNLEDCIFHVSFTNDDIELNDKGVLVLHMTVWEQELFDAADITGLKAGDTLVVRGEDIAVSSVENADGIIHVNGGVENGGISLSPSESGGTFCETNAEVAEYDVSYTSVAQLVLPVDADSFVYTDSSDLERGEKTYLADDLLTMKDDADFSCTAMNGTAHIVNNQVVEITRVYMP